MGLFLCRSLERFSKAFRVLGRRSSPIVARLSARNPAPTPRTLTSPNPVKRCFLAAICTEFGFYLLECDVARHPFERSSGRWNVLDLKYTNPHTVQPSSRSSPPTVSRLLHCGAHHRAKYMTVAVNCSLIALTAATVVKQRRHVHVEMSAPNASIA